MVLAVLAAGPAAAQAPGAMPDMPAMHPGAGPPKPAAAASPAAPPPAAVEARPDTAAGGAAAAAPAPSATAEAPSAPVNIYAAATAAGIAPQAADALPRVYVPNVASGDVYVIDPATMKVVDRFRVARDPQHVIPSWDLKTLWVAGSKPHRGRAGLTPIDPTTARPGETFPLEDAYNLYFTPDGTSAIVVAEEHRRLEFRDPQSMVMQASLDIPECNGINHADFTLDERYAIFTCEFTGLLVKIDLKEKKTVGSLKLSKGGMPQDIRISPDGKKFYVADMHSDGVFIVDGETMTETGFIDTGVGAHGLYPSRDGTRLYVANRGTHMVRGRPKMPGSVSVIDFATDKVVANWPVPGGGSPDMGNVSADGKTLWLSGRFDNVVYAFDTTSGAVTQIKVGTTPHGLTVWPQPGRYSLGHTGNMR
jgi:YVTN family beta-propeller protein